MTLHLHDACDLERARRLVSWLHRPSLRAVEVSLPWLDGLEQRRAATTLRRYFNDCGCGWGAAAFIAALLGGLAWNPWPTQQLWLAIGAAVLAAVTAKLAALAWSRWRLAALLARLTLAPEIRQHMTGKKGRHHGDGVHGHPGMD